MGKFKQGDIWPVTILKDRYQGTYSGTQWLAFNLEFSQLPNQILGSDPEEMWFWADGYLLYPWLIIGKGRTIEEAYNNLEIQWLDRMNNIYKNPLTPEEAYV